MSDGDVVLCAMLAGLVGSWVVAPLLFLLFDWLGSVRWRWPSLPKRKKRVKVKLKRIY